MFTPEEFVALMEHSKKKVESGPPESSDVFEEVDSFLS